MQCKVEQLQLLWKERGANNPADTAANRHLLKQQQGLGQAAFDFSRPPIYV
jgi:hypothetical protein